jgi:hypothetical protein
MVARRVLLHCLVQFEVFSDSLASRTGSRIVLFGLWSRFTSQILANSVPRQLQLLTDRPDTYLLAPRNLNLHVPFEPQHAGVLRSNGPRAYLRGQISIGNPGQIAICSDTVECWCAAVGGSRGRLPSPCLHIHRRIYAQLDRVGRRENRQSVAPQAMNDSQGRGCNFLIPIAHGRGDSGSAPATAKLRPASFP